MDKISLLYAGLYSLAWLFGLQESITEKEARWFIILEIMSGTILLSGIVLFWPENLPSYIKQSWKYFFVFMILLEVIKFKYEIGILKKRLSEDEGKIDTSTILLTTFVALIFVFPGFYYNFQVAFG